VYDLIIFVGFNIWLTFVFSYQLHFQLSVGKLWKKRYAAGEVDGLNLYRIVTLMVTILNQFGIFGFLLVVADHSLYRQGYFAFFGTVAGFVLFFIVKWLFKKSEVKYCLE
jgi:hypothetical protein